MTVFFNGGKARTADFSAGDVGYIPKTFAHYIENTGTTNLTFLKMFKAERFRDLSLSVWLSHTPEKLVCSISRSAKRPMLRFPKAKLDIVPA